MGFRLRVPLWAHRQAKQQVPAREMVDRKHSQVPGGLAPDKLCADASNASDPKADSKTSCANPSNTGRLASGCARK